MRLDIRWIACHDLSAAGKNDALTPLVSGCTKDIVGSHNIVVKECKIEIGIRVGGCREVDNRIDVSAGLLASVKVSNIEWIDFMALTFLYNQRSRLPVS
jgi:hypothetical protein